jgi:hypothetical protein
MHTNERGAVLVESTLTTSVIMLIALGGLSLASIGYARISSDASAFYAAHTYAQAISIASNDAYLTTASAASATAIANRLVAELIPGNFPATIRQVPIANLGMGAGIDSSYYTPGSRHGGVSLVVPEGQQAFVADQTGGIYGIGSSIGVNGVAMEPTMEIVNPDFDIAGNPSFDSTTGAARYFGTGMDQGPYYLSHNYVKYCGSRTPWSGRCGTRWKFDAYGVAEYLDSDNIAQPKASVLMGSQGNPNVFAAMLCHQRVYAYIAQNFFPPAAVYPNLPARPVYTSTASNPYNEISPMPSGTSWKQQPFKFVYSWDAYIPDGYVVAAGDTVGTMPLAPLNGCYQVDAAF